jgi:hypothetical protein
MAKDDEIGRAYSTDGREQECIRGFCGEARRKETLRKTKTYV